MAQNELQDDLLGQNVKNAPQETALESLQHRKPRRDEYHEGFILKGESL